MKGPLELTMKLRNNCLKSRRMELGLSAAQIAERIGLSYKTYLALESLRDSPMGKSGEWRPSALRIADFWACQPQELWPDIVLSVVAPVAVRVLTEEQALALLPSQSAGIAAGLPPAAPDDVLEAKQQRCMMLRCLESLSPIERRIVEWTVMDDVTLEEAGERYGGLSKTRIAQIRNQALSKIQHAARHMRLREGANRRVRWIVPPGSAPRPATCDKCGGSHNVELTLWPFIDGVAKAPTCLECRRGLERHLEDCETCRRALDEYNG